MNLVDGDADVGSQAFNQLFAPMHDEGDYMGETENGNGKNYVHRGNASASATNNTAFNDLFGSKVDL